MRQARGIPGIKRHFDAGFLEQRLRQRGGERGGIRFQYFQCSGHHLGHGYKIAPQILRQRLDQKSQLVAQQARHQPVAAVFIHLIEQMQRHDQGHTIEYMAGIEAVGQIVGLHAHDHGIGELLLGHLPGSVAHEEFACEEQAPRFRALGFAAPFFEIHRAVNAFGNARGVERDNRLIVHQHIMTA